MQVKSNQKLEMVIAEGDAKVENFKQQISTELSQHVEMKNLKRILNKRRVVEHAIEKLTDESPNETDELPNDESATTLELDEDWLNYFEEYAEKVSSEQLQILWARILAGQISRPTSFSLATLRFMSEVDKECAQLFEKATEYCLEDGFILSPNEMEGQLLLDLIFLEEVGLLQEVSSNLQKSSEPDSGGFVQLKNGQYVLVLKATSRIYWHVIRVTRIGREIMKILPPKNSVPILENFFKGVHGSVTEATIYLLPDQTDDQVLTKVVKVLKREGN